jgi:membrane protease YdiL (CAAX protease family)
MNERVDSRKVGWFVGLTFLVSWLFIGTYVLLGGRWNSAYAPLVGAVYMFMPGTAAVVVQRGLYKRPIGELMGGRFRLNRWFVVAWLGPPGVALAALGLSLLMPGATFTTSIEPALERFAAMMPPDRRAYAREQAASLPLHPFWMVLLGGLIAGPTINAVAGFGEELGWRGFLQRELAPLGFWRACFVIGVIWGIWHAPIILLGHNYPQHPRIGVALMTLLTVLLSPLFAAVAMRAKSVVAAAVFHGSFNASAGLPLLVVAGGNDLTTGVSGLAGLIVLATINVALFVRGRPTTCVLPGAEHGTHRPPNEPGITG